jgi:hypothetical protein
MANFIRQATEQRAAKHASGADDDEVGREIADRQLARIKNNEVGERR